MARNNTKLPSEAKTSKSNRLCIRKKLCYFVFWWFSLNRRPNLICTMRLTLRILQLKIATFFATKLQYKTSMSSVVLTIIQSVTLSNELGILLLSIYCSSKYNLTFIKWHNGDIHNVMYVISISTSSMGDTDTSMADVRAPLPSYLPFLVWISNDYIYISDKVCKTVILMLQNYS